MPPSPADWRRARCENNDGCYAFAVLSLVGFDALAVPVALGFYALALLMFY